MSKSTISTFEFFQMFPDAEAARDQIKKAERKAKREEGE